MIYLLAIPAAALLAAWLDLFVLPRGLRFTYRPGTPEALRFRVRRNSWIVRLVNPSRGPWSGLTIGTTIHLSRGTRTLTPWLVAHELAHAIRQRGQVASYLWRYVTSGAFRAGEEAACDAWAHAHRDDSPFGTVARIMGAA